MPDSNTTEVDVSDCGAFDSGLCMHPDGKVSPCCQFDKGYFQNVTDLDWTRPWEELRDGRGCSMCKNKKGSSYKDTFDSFKNKEFAIRYLDVRNSNLCNFECVMCNSYYSSKWAERTFKPKKFIKYDYEFDMSDVRKIYFAGGEPMLHKTHWNILDELVSDEKYFTENIGLIYSTNLSVVGDALHYWPKFSHIFVNASLDGIGHFGEQLRPGLDWEKFERNINLIKDLDNVEIEIACTVTCLNIWHLESLDTWAKNKEIRVKYYPLYHPNYYDISVLPQELKDQVEWIPDDPDIKDRFSYNTSHEFRNTIGAVLAGDRLRKTDLWGHLPFKTWTIKNMIDY